MKSKGTLDYSIVVLIVGKLFYSFTEALLNCEVGNQLDDRFAEINTAVYDTNWYTYTPKIQCTLPTILMATQQPSNLHAFGNFPCSRETFQRVISFQILKFM